MRTWCTYASSIVFLACGGGAANTQAPAPVGRSARERTLLIGTVELPPLPPSLYANAPPLDVAVTRVEVALSLTRPPLPLDASAEAYRTWLDNDYATWIENRGRAVRGVHDSVEPLQRADSASPDEALRRHVVASTLMGVVYADFGSEIASSPIPRAAAPDQSSRILHRDAYLRSAAQLFRRARDSFGACASACVRSADPSLDSWSRYCEEAITRLEDRPRPIEDQAPEDDADAPTTH